MKIEKFKFVSSFLVLTVTLLLGACGGGGDPDPDPEPINIAPVANAGPDQKVDNDSTVQLSGIASSDTDGDTLSYNWSISSAPNGSTAALVSADTVTPEFQPDQTGVYVIQLTVNDGALDSSPDLVEITLDPVAIPNTAPIANAGPDQTVDSGSVVQLSGAASSDIDGDTLSYNWSISSAPNGSTVALVNTDTVAPEFQPDQTGVYIIQLTVNDGALDSSPDLVEITLDPVATPNTAPVADAGPDQTVDSGSVVQLSGTASSDIDGDTLSYNWSISAAPTGSTASLVNAGSVTPEFQPDQTGSYVIQLIVNDGTLDSSPDLVEITLDPVATPNTAPVADAGPDQTVDSGSVVQLSGTASSDIDGDTLSYSWSISAAPTGSTASLVNAGSVTPEFQPDQTGSYVIQLIVNDGTLDSTPDQVAITVEAIIIPNTAPTANAGSDQTVDIGTLIQLTGIDSIDAEADTLSYSWSIFSAPNGSTALLVNTDSVKPEFQPDQTGSYIIQLIVNDGELDSAADLVEITIEAIVIPNTAPTANAGSDQSVEIATLVQLTGIDSIDAEGDTLSYSWSITSAPNGSTATLVNSSLVASEFQPDLEGTYIIQLIVNDGQVDSTPDQLTLIVYAENPISIAILSPVSLVTVGVSPVSISGTVSPQESILTINGVPIEHLNGIFTADVNIDEGLNAIVARAVVSQFQLTDSISIALDETPPSITIDSHEDGDTLYIDSITVTGLINDIVRGTIEEGQASISVNGVIASISNRSYSATGVTLSAGSNAIVITGTDQVGNVSTKTINLNYVVPTGRRIELVSGNGQSATIGELLTNVLTVKVLDKDLNLLVGESVVFRVEQGAGLVGDAVTLEDRANIIQTDINGLASINFRIGERVGIDNHKVSANIVGYDTEVIFTASATGQLGDKISINSGNNQRGAVGQRLPAPLVTSVSDSGGNVVNGARVRFDVTAGNGSFENGLTTIEITTDSDGRTYAQYILGSTPGIDAQQITATLLDTNIVEPLIAGFTATAYVAGDAGNTSISGLVLDNQDNPLAGVTLNIEGTTRTAVADSEGKFKITEAPVGPVHLLVDGSTSLVPGEYPSLSFDIVTVAGVDNTLYQPIYMVKLTETNTAYAGLEDVEITMEEFPGFKLEVAKDSVTFPGGEREGFVSVTFVNANKVPMVPPNGTQPQFVITVQPSGALFDPPAKLTIPNVDGLKPGQQTEMYSFDHDLVEFVAIGLGTVSEDGSVITSNPGVGIIKAGWFLALFPGGVGDILGWILTIDPNEPFIPSFVPVVFEAIGDTLDNFREGSASCTEGDITCNPVDSNEDHRLTAIDENGLIIADASQDINPSIVLLDIDPETNLPRVINNEPFDEKPDWVDNLFDLFKKGADPISMATGELEYTQTDLKIPGRGFDFELKRTYRSRLQFNGRLGYNWVFNYHQLLAIPEVSATDQNIIRSMEDGRQFTYISNADGTYVSPNNRFDTLRKNADDSFTIRKPNGFKINFNTQGQMVSQVDRYGNTMEFLYDTDSRLSTVIDTLGREIVFNYRIDSGHIDTVTDYSGRSVRYYYDSNRDLIAARTPIISSTPNSNDFTNGKHTVYTYSAGFDEVADPRLKQANHNLLTVTDPQGNLYIGNTYNNDPDSYEFDRITTQQYGTDSELFQLTYEELNASVVDKTPNLPTSRTVMIDRIGNRYEYLLNTGGMLLEESVFSNRNVNQDDPEVFVTSYTYNNDGLKLSETNPEGDSVAYQYDTTNTTRYMQRNLLSSTYTPSPRGATQTELVESFTYEPVYNQIKSITNRRNFTTTNTYDYQHADNLPALATELALTQIQVTDLLTVSGLTLEGGVSGQIVGNVVRVDSPDATLPDDSSQAVYIERTFNRFGQMIEQIDAEGLVTQFEYYAENDPDGDGINSTSTRTLATDTGGYRKTVIKDARLDTRRTRSGTALAIRTETVYDAVGNKVIVTDGRGNSTRFIRNSLNQVVRKIASTPFEYLTDYYYDANNNLVRTSQQNVSTVGPNLSGFTHTITRYNLLNDKTSEIQIPASGVYLETLYEYDANQNLIAIQQPEGNRVERTYDERDLVHTITRGAGTALASTRTLTYDGNGNLLKETDAEDNNGDGNPENTLLTYDGYNRLIQTVDAEGNRMVYGYDANNNKVIEQHFGASGIVGIDNEILLAETTAQFDELDRNYQRDDSLLVNGLSQNVGSGLTPDDNKVTGVNWLDANGLAVRSVDDNGKQSLSNYDGLNRRILVTDANGNLTSSVYDNNNNITQVSVTQKSVEALVPDKVISSTLTYDELNRKTSETNNLGNTNSYRYDSKNNLIQTTDALGNISLFIHDGLNRLLEERNYLATDGVGTGALDSTNPTNRDGSISTFYTYDANSRLVSQTDDNGNVTSYGYDSLNRKVLTTYADTTTVAYAYDKDDNLVTKTDQNGSVFTHSYDVLNRLVDTSVVSANGLIGSNLWTYSYDGLSRRMSATDNNDPELTIDDSTVEYRYNSLNYLLSETNNGLAAQATYDGLGNRQTLLYPDSRLLNYSYDDIYNLKAISEGTDNIVQYDYAGSRVLERRYNNGTKLSYIEAANDSDYDAINRVLQHKHTDSSDLTIAEFDYSYDKANNRRYEIDQFTQLADVYEYDSVYRLIRAAYRVPANDSDLIALVNNENNNADVATITSPQDETYLLDGVGNWASLQTVENAISNAVGYQANVMNEYEKIGAIAKTHDDNGNLTSDGEKNYHFDAKNRLVRVTTLGGNTIANYKYDAFGRRVEKKAGSETVRYVHFGKRVLEERNVFSQLQRQYVYGNGVDEVLQLRSASNDDFYYHDNSIGSVVAMSDSTGSVVERYDYNAYGVTSIFEADGITQRISSAVGNSYGYTGRRHDRETGFYYYRARYYSPERGRFVQRDPLGYADGMGVYVYVGNNPVNFIDPDGTKTKQLVNRGIDNLQNRIEKAGDAYQNEKNIYNKASEELLEDWTNNTSIKKDGGPISLLSKNIIDGIHTKLAQDVLISAGKKKEELALTLYLLINKTGEIYNQNKKLYRNSPTAIVFSGMEVGAEIYMEALGRIGKRKNKVMEYAGVIRNATVSTAIVTIKEELTIRLIKPTTSVITEGASVYAGIKGFLKD
jgi:RHS repeat-associated protein